MKLKSLILCAILTASASTAFAAGHENMNPDAQGIDTACAPDSQTASCGSDKVGTGLLKCLWAYKKAHKDYKFTDGCREAMAKAKADRKAKK